MIIFILKYKYSSYSYTKVYQYGLLDCTEVLTFDTFLISPFWCETLDLPLAEGMALSKSGSSSFATKCVHKASST